MSTKALAVTLCVALSVAAHAQQAPAGPTMDETKAWLESDGKDLMRAVRLQSDRSSLSIFQSEERVDSIMLNNCVLNWRALESTKTTTFSRGGQQKETLGEHTTDVTVTLRDLTLGGITAETDSTLTDKPIQIVRLTLAQPREASSFSSRDFGNPTAIRAASLPVQSADDSQRIVNAIKWAATLCGVGARKGLF